MTEINVFMNPDELGKYHSVINLDGQEITDSRAAKAHNGMGLYRIPDSARKVIGFKRNSATIEQVLGIELHPSRFEGQKYFVRIDPFVRYNHYFPIDFGRSGDEVHTDLETLFNGGVTSLMNSNDAANLVELDGKSYAVGFTRKYGLDINRAFYSLLSDAVNSRKNPETDFSPSMLQDIAECFHDAKKRFVTDYYENAFDLGHKVMNNYTKSHINDALKFVKKAISGRHFVGDTFKDYLLGIEKFENNRMKDFVAVLIPASGEMVDYYVQNHPVNYSKAHEEHDRMIEKIPDGPL